MCSDLLVPAVYPGALSTDVADLARDARQLASEARSANTVRAYRSDWLDFERWCGERGLLALPTTAEAVAVYLTALSQSHKVSTITRRLSAISQAHRGRGLDSPAQDSPVRLVLAGIRRRYGTAAETKRPVLVPELRAMVEALPDNLLGVRDRALLLVGFAGAFRRSELVAVNYEDLAETADGLVILIRRSKTDPEGAGRKIAIPRGREETTCPLRAMRAWCKTAGISAGAVFLRVNRHGTILPERLSAEAVAIAVKRAAARLGFDGREFAGHSLRSGLATSAAIAGKSERSIMSQTGHRSTSILRRYIRDGNLFRENAAEGLGL